MVCRSRAYPICIFCIWVLAPCTLYAMGANMFLLATGRTDEVIKPNTAIMLTTVRCLPVYRISLTYTAQSFLSSMFMILWILAISNTLARVPPPSGKKVAFMLLVMSTVFWIASLWTGVEVSRRQPICREGAGLLENPAPWSDGVSCRVHRLGVAFSAFGWLISPSPPPPIPHIAEKFPAFHP